MGLGSMQILALLMVLSGIGAMRDLWRHRRETFDRDYQWQDRRRIGVAAFYILLPISVALHELGHAIAVWSFGGTVVDFGFYFFAGFVAYNDYFSPVQEVVVAAAGTIVNILLVGLVLAIIFFRPRPMRAAYNDLLFNFASISLINALVVYPLLDFATGMHGDFYQMYTLGPQWLTMTILVIHVGILAISYLLLQNDGFNARIAVLTGLPPGAKAKFRLGRQQQQSTANREEPVTLSLTERSVQEAAKRVASGWPSAVSTRFQRQGNLSVFMLLWPSVIGRPCAIAVQIDPSGPVAIAGVIQGTSQAQPLARWPTSPSTDQLVLAMRQAMEAVARLADEPTGASTMR